MQKPVSTRWTIVNKGDLQNPEVRARWVARDFKTFMSDEFFAATPPWEVIVLLISLAASQGDLVRGLRGGHGHKQVKKLGLIDISRAYFHAEPLGEVYVELPAERAQPGKCGKLRRCLYGQRGAAAAFQKHVEDRMRKWDFVNSRGCACLFTHRLRDLRVVVHGDDFVSLGCDADLDWFEAAVKSEYTCKVKGRLGPGRGDLKSARLLNRVISWEADGLTLEADQRHAEIIVRDLGLDKCKGSVVPGTKEANDVIIEGDEELDSAGAKQFRGLAARANFLAIDRGDIQYSVKETCRSMARPTRSGWDKLRKLGRYLKSYPSVVRLFKWQDPPGKVIATVDSDHAGCLRTRKSTSGGSLWLGTHVLKTWASTQSTIAISVGEAEYYAIVKGASQALGLQSLLCEIGIKSSITVRTDSASAKGMSSRVGLGKTRHVAVNLLWVQQRVRRGDISISKIPGLTNPADLFTKYLTGPRIVELSEQLNQVRREGRHELAPKI